MRTSSRWPILLSAVLVVAACRGDRAGRPDGGADAAVDYDDVSIYALQQDSTAFGSDLEKADRPVFNVRGVVVSAIDRYGHRTGNFWVQEPEGGPYSGILVYGAPVREVEGLQVGDVIDLEHLIVAELAARDDDSGRSVTELIPPDGGQISVRWRDRGEPPAPAPVDVLALGRLPTAEARDAEWAKWEGVLITIADVAVLRELRQIGSTPETPPFVEMHVTGITRVDSSLAALEPVTLGDCLARVTGVVDYFYNYKLLPRATDEVVPGGEACPAAEAVDECDDGIDNDANGYADCADRACRGADACLTDSVTAIQMGTTTGPVGLNDVVITALSRDRRHAFVADALQAAPYNGVFVYRGVSAVAVPLGEEYQIGAVVDVAGTTKEHDVTNPPVGMTQTQIEAFRANDLFRFEAAAAGEPAPLAGVALATLADVAGGAPYEGVLVTLSDVELIATASGFRLTVQDAAGQTLVVDDDLFAYGTTFPVGTCFASLTGIMGIHLTDDERRLWPRRLEDMVSEGGVCGGE
jgi:hypothetical protein